jgi:23S rRNA (cytidine1920-2'-O)/16S rRNA (cytidine1409-2'-O)-methyltransferase
VPLINRSGELESHGRAGLASRKGGWRIGAQATICCAMARIRADQLLVDRGLAESRTRAQALILAGLVYVGDRKIAKAGDQVAPDALLDVRGRDHPWVSRGGIKLDHALAHFGWDVTDAVAIDVGSSTGGFTDVLLTRGAAKVYAVDSGTNQLAWKLRQDARVVVLEKTNARNLTTAEIPEAVNFIVCDASFISLAKVLKRPITFAKPQARMVALIKPQFEAGREEVGKGGVVRDPAIHERVCAEARVWVESQGWHVIGIEKSPITGPEGNVEFLLAAVRGDPS